jgi:toxin ParE1/3/4
MQVKWLRKALLNLDQEAAHIAKDNPKAAAEFVTHVRHSVSVLFTHPNMGRQGRVPGTRELVITQFPYILPYRVRENRVEILRVFHTARKWPTDFN